MNFNFNSPKNWTEDFDQENGCYINICPACNHEFMGHKRRYYCKECEPKPKPNANKEFYKKFKDYIDDVYIFDDKSFPF